MPEGALVRVFFTSMVVLLLVMLMRNVTLARSSRFMPIILLLLNVASNREVFLSLLQGRVALTPI